MRAVNNDAAKFLHSAGTGGLHSLRENLVHRIVSQWRIAADASHFAEHGGGEHNGTDGPKVSGTTTTYSTITPTFASAPWPLAIRYSSNPSPTSASRMHH